MIGEGGPEGLAGRVAARLGARLVEARVRVFPDGESKVTLDRRPGAGGRVVVVQSTPPPVDSNLIKALSLVQEACHFSDHVTAAVPYMGYARQDRRFLPGEVVTMDVVARLFEAAGASRMLVVDIHSSAALERFAIPATSVTAVPILAARCRRMNLERPVVVSPDAGGAARAALFASELGTDWAELSKRRDKSTGSVRIAGARGAGAAGRDVVLVDDMVSTGGSVAEAARFLAGRGCGRIVVACTHPLLVGGAREKLAEAGVRRMVCCNTVGGPGKGGGWMREVDVSGALSKQIEWWGGRAPAGRRRGRPADPDRRAGGDPYA